ncbi:MAG: hypothetical protein ACPGVK_10150 [Halocynthiibacter sp.]
MTITKNMKICVPILAVAVLAACGKPTKDKTTDQGFLDAGNKPLSTLKAGIWVDPTGCDHWIIDDGIEGYLSARLDRNGKPVCSGISAPNTAVGDFRGGAHKKL